MDPMTILGIGAGLNTLYKLFSGRPKTGMVDPEQYKGDLTYSDADIGKMRSSMMGDITQRAGALTGRAISGVKQAGAAGRMPSGAVLSGIAGAHYQGAKGIAEGGAQLMPRLQEMKRGSMMDYYNLANRYGMGEAQMQNQWREGWQGDIGQFTKLAMLYKAGYFNQPGGGGGPEGMPRYDKEELWT